MTILRNIVISIEAPSAKEVGWLQPQSDGTYKLYFYGNDGWVLLVSNEVGSLDLSAIKEVPDIIINN